MKTQTVEAVVVALIPEFEFVHLEAANGDTLSIGKSVEGVDWRTLRLGQKVRCEYVGEHATRVLRAEILPDSVPEEFVDVPRSDESSARHMRVFLDTEFAGPPELPVLLSFGLVAEDGDVFYQELPAEELAALPAALVDDFLKDEVLSQFGRVTDGSATRTAMANALIEWLNELDAAQVEVVYDFGTDYAFIEALTETASAQLRPRLLPCHVGYLLDDPKGKEAAEWTWGQLGPDLGLRRHHALVDAFALRSRFQAVHGTA